MRLVPASLTARLAVTTVALVALVCVLIAAVATLALRTYLLDRLDEDVRSAAFRISDPVGPPVEDGGGHGPAGPGDDPFPVQSLRQLTAVIPPTGVADAEGYVLDGRGAERLSSRALTALADLDGRGVATVDVPGAGRYRLVAVDDPDSDGEVVVGLPTAPVDQVVTRLVVLEAVLVLLGTLAAAGAAYVLVRRQLAPLREVARTAHDVAALPLATGAVGTTARVPARLTDEGTEVGQVGGALNTLLGHVEQALDARHRSEQQVRQFVADASHELRTPLATIQGYAELSRRTSPPDPGVVVGSMAKVEGEAVRMTGLVEDLLLLARLDAGRPLQREDVDLTRMALEGVADARVVAPEHRFVLDLPDEPVTVTGDEQRLHQVLSNLVGNARRHTPPGTTVTVSVRGDGPGAVLVVSDDGPGIAPELVPTVFERFTRGDSARTRETGGAGLGLSLVAAIVAAHGGRIDLDSRPGDTRFTVTLP